MKISQYPLPKEDHWYKQGLGILYTIHWKVAFGGNFLSEYAFHLYGATRINSNMHGLSSIGITAITLNFYLTKKYQIILL